MKTTTDSRLSAETEDEPISVALRWQEQPGLTLARMFWRERRFLYRVWWRSLLACAIITLLIPNRYESIARIMPPETQNSGTMSLLMGLVGAGGLGGPLSGALGVKSSSDLFVGILQSERVQQSLVDRFDLRKVYGVRYNVEARKKLSDKTNVAEDRKSGIISISVDDRDRQRATAMARAYVEELDRTVTQVSTSSARRERIFLEARLQDVKHDLDAAANAFSQFASKNTAIDIPQQGKSMVEAAARLEGELIAAKSEMKGLEQIYSDNNIRVRSVKARVTELQHQLDKLGGAASTSGEPQSMYPSIRQLPLLGVTYADLYRQTKIQEAVYEILTKEYEMAKVQEAKEIPTVRVLDYPTVPEKKAFPPRLLMISLGSLLAFVLGLSWVGAGWYWQALPADHSWKLFLSHVADSSRPSPESAVGKVVHAFRRLGESLTRLWRLRRRTMARSAEGQDSLSTVASDVDDDSPRAPDSR